jgi:hypothetical protein
MRGSDSPQLMMKASQPGPQLAWESYHVEFDTPTKRTALLLYMG